eukprot:351292-Chlamydomonas_euryale.AAC.2
MRSAQGQHGGSDAVWAPRAAAVRLATRTGTSMQGWRSARSLHGSGSAAAELCNGACSGRPGHRLV